MTAEKHQKIPIYQDNTTANPSRGGCKSLETSAGHTFGRIRPLWPGFITPTASLCVSKERCGAVGGGKAAKLAGACFGRQPVKTRRPPRASKHKTRPRCGEREASATRRELLVPVISFQTTAVEAPEERRAQSVAVGPLPPAATARHDSHAR